MLEETGVVCVAEPTALFAFDVAVNSSLQYVVVDVRASWVSGEPRAADDARNARFIAAGEFASMKDTGIIHPATATLVEQLGVFAKAT